MTRNTSPRRKPKLFAFSREVELSHFAEWSGTSEDRRLLEALVDAFATVCEARELRPGTLAPLVAAARHRDPQLQGAAFTRLAVMCHYFPEAIEEMASLCADPHDGVRQFATRSLGNTPAGVAGPLLSRLLLDPSPPVRLAAAEVAAAVSLPEVVGLLARRTAEEPVARVRRALVAALEFQRRPPDQRGQRGGPP